MTRPAMPAMSGVKMCHGGGGPLPSRVPQKSSTHAASANGPVPGGRRRAQRRQRNGTETVRYLPSTRLIYKKEAAFVHVWGLVCFATIRGCGLDQRGDALACFDIGGSFVRYGRADADELPHRQGETATPLDDFDAFARVLTAGIEETGASAAALSIAGVIDPTTGRADIANIACLNGRKLVSDLERALGVPVTIANDADCFALAEAHHGAGRKARTVFAIILGTGVGGGIVIDGSLLSARAGISGEWGHGPAVDPTAGGLAPGMPALACGCGLTGCLDAIGSARGMERIHRHLHGIDATSVDITAAAQDGEPKAANTLDVWAAIVARSLSMVVNTLGPHIIPVGGGLAGEPGLIARINAALGPLVLARPDKPLLVAGEHVRDGGLIGAAIAARQADEPHRDAA